MTSTKKGQATIFILLGIVLIIVVVAMVMLGRFAAKKTTTEETVDASEALFDIQPIENFVSECVTITTKNAIDLIGKQGGYIYSSQGGTLLDYRPSDEGSFFVQHQGFQVSYNILTPKFSIGDQQAKIPEYPWISFPLLSTSSTQETFSKTNAFGRNAIPPLNKSFGAHSLEEQISRYLFNNVDICLENSVFEDLGFIVEKGEKNVKTNLHENDIVVKLFYELDVENVASGDTTSLREFITTIPIRIGALHFFVNDLITQDVSDIQFDIKEHSGTNNFLVETVENVNANDDLIIVTDLDATVLGDRFKYIFARQNRNPALYYASPPVLRLPSLDENGVPTAITDSTFFNAYPTLYSGLDPDEDDVTFALGTYPPIVIDGAQVRVSVSDGSLEDYQIITIQAE